MAEISELPDVDAAESAELEALTRNVQQTFSSIVESSPLPARGAAARGRQHRRPERAQPPHRRLAAPEGRGEAGAARGGRRRAAPAAPRRDPRARARGHLDRLGDPEPGPVRDRQGPARVRPAPAARGDPQRARRVRRVGRRGQRAARAARRDRAARGRPPPGRPRAQAPGDAAAAGRRARRHPHLPGVDRLAAVGQDDRGQPRPRARARGPRRGPLRHRAGQGPHPRVPRRAQAQARRARLDPVLRRAARRGQDLARALDRARAGAQVRAHQRRRRARRGRDPRPPAHLHRRDARDDHPRAARRGVQEPAVHDRRDRQDGRRLPRRSRQRDARGARPRAERDLPRPLPRRAVRPLERHVHHHGATRSTRSPGRCATAWRSSSSRATPRRRSSRSPSATSCRARSSATA